MDFRDHDAVTAIVGPMMTVVLLFGSAVRSADLAQRAKLIQTQGMLEQRRPLKDIAEAIFEIMGPEWTPDEETMKMIESINA